MIHVENHFAAVKGFWAKKILEEESQWNFIAKNLINNTCNMNLIVRTNNPETKMLNRLPTFYEQVLHSILKVNKSLSREPTELDELLIQPIWNNINITHTVNRKTECFYYKNWIENDILYIKDLKFKNGKLDENHCYKYIKKKTNIWAETLNLKKALGKYQNILKNRSDQNNNTAINEPESINYKTQHIRKILNNEVFTPPKFKLLKELKPNIEPKEIEKILTYKIQKEKDKKLSEFYYKVLTDNLATAEFLKHWVEGLNENCEICKKVDSTKHILFECKLSKNFWETVECSLELNISPKRLLIEENDTHIEETLKICVNLLYKFWIEVVNKKTKRNANELVMYMSKNLLCTSDIYFLLHKRQTAENLKKIREKIS